jgi:hypothetical protein
MQAVLAQVDDRSAAVPTRARYPRAVPPLTGGPLPFDRDRRQVTDRRFRQKCAMLYL